MTTVRRRIFILHGSHYLTDHHFNGDGLVAWGFISELARRGHRVHVLTDRLDVRSPVPANLTIREIPRTSSNPVLHYASYARRARTCFDRIAASEGVDVVHQMNPVVRGLSLALLGTRVPIVLGTYVGDWSAAKLRADLPAPNARDRAMHAGKRAIDAVQQRFATRLVLATPHALGRIPFAKLATPRIRYLHHGVDTELYEPGGAASDPATRDCTILYLGSFHLQKGVMDLVEAFARVAARLPEARIVFVGGGAEHERMRARLRECGLLERAEFPGRARRSEVAGWLRACTVLCAPSYGEPYGQNVLEAMATAKPVVITTAGGHRYLSDARGKLDVRPGDVDGLAAALFAVLDDPERRASMSLANRAIAERIHAWPNAVDGLEAIYEDAIAAKRRAAR